MPYAIRTLAGGKGKAVKIKPTDLSDLRVKIEELLVANPEARKAHRDAGLSHERFRWNVLHASKANADGHLYTYLNDSHIDSALKSLLGRDWE